LQQTPEAATPGDRLLVVWTLMVVSVVVTDKEGIQKILYS
jgi:hypothetical protein